MRKFLKINLIVFSLLLLGVAGANAISKYDFYSEILSDFGINSFTYQDLNEITQAKPSQSTGVRWLEDLFLKYISDNQYKLDRPYLTILSSDFQSSDQVNVFDLVSNKTIILICDSDFTLEGKVKCGFSNIEPLTEDTKFIIGKVTISKWESFDNTIIAVPSVYLLTPEYSNVLGNYLKAYHKSNFPYDEIKPIINFKFVDPNIQKLFFQVVYIVIISSILRKFFINIISNPRKFIVMDTYKEVLGNLEGWFLKSRRMYLVILLPLLSIYLASLILISLKDVGAISALYIANYLSATLNLLYEGQFVVLGPTKLIISIFSSIIMLVSFFVFAPAFINFIKIGENKIKAAKIKSKIRNILLTLVPIMLIFSILVLNGSKFIPITASLVIIYLYLLSIETDEDNLALNYTLRRRRFILIIVGLVLCSGIYIHFSSSNRNFKAPNSDLLEESDRVVILPYFKNYTEGDVYKKYEIDVTDPIFVNNFLVAHPRYSLIRNVPVTQFNPNGNFLIIADTLDSLAEEMTENSNLRSWYLAGHIGDIYSRLFVIDNFNSTPKDNFDINLKYRCDKDIETFKFLLRVFHSSYSSGETPYRNIEFFNNPSCIKGQEYNITVPVNMNNVPDGTIIFELVTEDQMGKLLPIDLGVNPVVKIYKNSEELPVTHVSYDFRFPIIENYSADSGVLNVYSVSNTEVVQFERKDSSVNISEFINYLIQNKYIKSHIKVWSSKDGFVIKNFYEED